MLKRYIGPIDEVSVIIAGQDFGLVKTGQAIPVPDEIANSVSWGDANWEDVTDKKSPVVTPDTNDEDKAAE